MDSSSRGCILRGSTCVLCWYHSMYWSGVFGLNKTCNHCSHSTRLALCLSISKLHSNANCAMSTQNKVAPNFATNSEITISEIGADKLLRLAMPPASRWGGNKHFSDEALGLASCSQFSIKTAVKGTISELCTFDVGLSKQWHCSQRWHMRKTSVLNASDWFHSRKKKIRPNRSSRLFHVSYYSDACLRAQKLSQNTIGACIWYPFSILGHGHRAFFRVSLH